MSFDRIAHRFHCLGEKNQSMLHLFLKIIFSIDVQPRTLSLSLDCIVISAIDFFSHQIPAEKDFEIERTLSLRIFSRE